MRANKMILLLLIVLSIHLSGCRKTAPGSATLESTMAETMDTIQLSEDVYEFPVMVSDDRELTICLYLAELEDFTAKEIQKIQLLRQLMLI